MERFFKKINEATGEIPLAGNTATRRFVVEEYLDEPNLERRKQRLPLTVAFTVFMAVAHAYQANLGIETMQKIHAEYTTTGDINQEHWSESLKFSFAFVYALVNALVTCSQLYLTYHLFASTDRLKRAKADAFFKEMGIDPQEAETPDLKVIAQYLVDATTDPRKQDILKNAIGEEQVRALLQSAEKTKDSDPFTITREEAEHKLSQIFEGTCLITPLSEPGTDYHKPLTTKDLVGLFVTMSGQAAIMLVR